MTTYRLTVTPLAEEDVRDGYQWYEQEAGLGNDFLAEIESQMKFVEANPLAYPLIEYGIRRAVIHRFPYNAYYVLDETNIRVLAIWPGRRNVARLLQQRRTSSN